ncbi:hydroxyacid dehydrogenase [Stappia sp. F7233]|uniref:Hydroxyacid dehydrogenase n=1 Tax=Stappia albiluteola TaxID=2758565 RepID=A0A839ABF4_9HYPH|nr:hydroxyacid dehydrogenase [Stappia albiluteola]MBA5776282.1 hydroxyacid dehydrogenase [Stappia albiluteola]
MADIIITEFMDEAAVERLSARHATVYDPALVDQPDRLAELVEQARVLIVRNRTQVRGALLEAGKKLECVGRLGVGLDNIDLAACKARGIEVFPATGANDLSVAEYVMTMALMLLRGAYGASAAVAGGQWPRQKLIGREVSGRVMGLVGYGAIAREVARRAAAFGMQVVAFDPYLPADDPRWAGAELVTLTELLQRADVVSLHVPLTETTRHMIGTAEIASMKEGAILVNAARGGVVDEAALAEALRAGRLGGAALDVFETEPLDAESGARFAGLDNLVLTPHIAGVTEESNIRVSDLIADTVLKFLDGKS